MSRTTTPKRRFLTRTRMAKEMGMTVPALKTHLSAAGLLDASGRMPSIVAYLKGAVAWRVMANDAAERFFLLDAAVVEELAPGLADAGDPNHVRSRHAAATLLGQAGHELFDAAPGDADDPDRLTPSIGWLMFENWEAVVVSSTQEKREFATRLERILAKVDAEIASGEIDGRSEAVPPARDKILSVIAWYRGERRPTGCATTTSLATHPIPVRVLDERYRLDHLSTDGAAFSIALSPDEHALLSGGHTLSVGAAASDAAAVAIERACARMVGAAATASYPYSPCTHFRMSVDNSWLFAFDATGSAPPRVFMAYLRDNLLTLGTCPDHLPSVEHERLSSDVQAGLLIHENATPVVWRPNAAVQ